MSEKMPINTNTTDKAPRFVSAPESGLTYTREAYEKVKNKAETLKPMQILDEIDEALRVVKSYRKKGPSIDELGKLRTSISQAVSDGFSQESSSLVLSDLSQISEMMEKLRPFEPFKKNGPEAEDYEANLKEFNSTKIRLKEMRDAIRIKAKTLQQESEPKIDLERKKSELNEAWAKSEAAKRAKASAVETSRALEDLRGKINPERKDSVESQVKELIASINKESGKIISSVMPAESWTEAGRKRNVVKGSAAALDGKKIKDADPDSPHAKISEYFDERSYGSAKDYSIPGAKPNEGFLTYKFSEGKQAIYEKRPQEITIEAPRMVMGVQIGTKKEKRTVMQDVYVDTKPATMGEMVESGDRRKAQVLAFRRLARCYDGRTFDLQITMVMPEDVAKKTSELLRAHPEKADELFMGVLPEWAKAADAKVKFEPVKHIMEG